MKIEHNLIKIIKKQLKPSLARNIKGILSIKVNKDGTKTVKVKTDLNYKNMSDIINNNWKRR